MGGIDLNYEVQRGVPRLGGLHWC